MAKFYKPGRVVVISNGRFAGRKGIIIRSNFEQTKTKRYPHCLVLGLKNTPRRVTKKYLKKQEERAARALEKKGQKGLQALKRFGVFTKTYNMNHIIATRYKITDNFGIDQAMNQIDNVETTIRDLSTKVNAKKDSTEQKDKDEVKTLQTQLGEARDTLKTRLNEFKVNVGTELFNRYMKGFVRGTNTEENDRIATSEFLFARLKF